MHIRNLQELALGSRLKMLSDRLFEGVELAYQRHGAGIQARWFLFLRVLQARGETSVTELADELGQTHAAVSQLAKKLLAQGLVETRRGDDQRKSLLRLSAEGVRRLDSLGPMWDSVREAVRETISASGHPLMDALAAFEAELERRPIAERIMATHARRNAARLEIVPFRPELREAFYRLNAEWLNRYYCIEDVDHYVLSQPEQAILDPGGEIFFALLDGEAVGTCAIKQEAPGVFELTKTAVTEHCQGLGIGTRLLDAAIAAFKSRAGTELFLESEQKLQAALHLYQKAGFELQPRPRPGSHYARSNVYMIYRGKPTGVAA